MHGAPTEALSLPNIFPPVLMRNRIFCKMTDRSGQLLQLLSPVHLYASGIDERRTSRSTQGVTRSSIRGNGIASRT